MPIEPPVERLAPTRTQPGPTLPGHQSGAPVATDPIPEGPTAHLSVGGSASGSVGSSVGGEARTDQLAAPVSPGTPPTELRVHGVSGTPAEEILDRQIVGQVAGDGEAGFFRPRTEYGATLGPGGARLEAYRWGNLTAGAAARAFWLLLLPFTLVNVAMWMRPPSPGLGRGLVHGITRVFSLTLSATLTLAVAGISFDLIGWQCASPQSRCLDQRPWLSVMFTGFFEPTGRRLALAALGPILLISVLWFLARRTWARYEAYHTPQHNPDGDGLATPTFWDGREQVSRLRSLHVATMFAVADALLASVLTQHDRNPGAYANVDLAGTPWQSVVDAGRVLFLASVAIIGLSLLSLLMPAVVDRVSKSRLAQITSDSLLWISLVVTALCLAYAVVPRAPWPTAGPLPYYADTVTILFAGQAGLLGLLVLVVLFQRHRCKGALFAGFAGPVVASLGLGLGAAISAGASYRVADYLDGSAVPSPAQFGARPETQGLQPPVSYQWAAVGFVAMVLIVLVAAIWLRFVTRPALARHARAETDQDYPGGRQRDKARARAIDKATANARLTDHVSRTSAVAWVLVAGMGLIATTLAVLHKGPVQLFASGSAAAYAVSIVANVGTYLISLSLLLLVVLGIQTYRNPRVRRTVGVIWDLATFWPRAAHPLAPPCYAERVVPELVHRSEWLAREQGGVVLSGHSQGSVLAAAAVLQLPRDARRATALLTYGSPICRLYVRAFPSYFNDAVLNDIGAAVAGPRGQERWVNLWRRSDPIGGAIGIGDRRLADPGSFDPLPGDQVPPKVQAHSGYQLTPQFGQAMDDLVGLLRQ